MKQTTSKLVSLAGVVVMTGTVLTGFSGQPVNASAIVRPIHGGTLTLDLNGNFPHLDPAKAYDTLSDEAVEQFYDQLVTYQGSSNTIIPDLASYKISNNGKKYTFFIKHAQFWNTQPVTATSFIAEFERVLNPSIQSGGSAFIDPLIVGSDAYAKGTAKTISGMKALNSHTLQITLSHPSATFLEVLAMPFFSAIDPTYVLHHTSAYVDTHPMGSGPFELTSYVSGKDYILTKNPHYFKTGIPYLNKIIFNVDGSPQAVMLNYEKGITGLISWNQGGAGGVPPQDYLPMSSSPKFSTTLHKYLEVAVYYLGLNTKYGVTQNVKVRRALEYAIDKNQIVKILGGLAVPANQVIPPSMPSGYEKNLPADASYSYNPVLAKKLLAQAGYSNGFHTSISTDNAGATDMRIAEAIQQMFANVGVKASIDVTSFSTFLNNNESGKQPIFTFRWLEDFPDPSDFLNTLFNSNQAPVNNSTNYSNSQVDALLNKGALMSAGTARNNIYKKAQNLILAEAPWIPLVYPEYVAAVQPWVKGFYFNPNLEDPLQYMWIAKK